MFTDIFQSDTGRIKAKNGKIIMALDFHRLDNQEYLFGLDSKKLFSLCEIFTEYERWTGVHIDEYGDTKLSVKNQSEYPFRAH